MLKQLGSHHVMIVHADDGMDEISIASDTFVAELKDGTITTYSVKPEDFGMTKAQLSDIRAADSNDSLNIIKSVFENKSGAAKDIVCLNAGAAIYVAGIADSLAAGVNKAQAVIEDGSAMKKLDALIHYSNNC